MSDDIRELRLLVELHETRRRLCKFVFSKTDASIYIVPYAPKGQYFYGGHRLAERQASETFDFTRQLSSDVAQLPKLSLHESGQVHVEVGHARAGPLTRVPLADWRGEHIASIVPDDWSKLAAFQGEPRFHGAERDLVLKGVNNARLVVYVNGLEPAFGGKTLFQFQLTRPTLPRPLHVGIQPLLQTVLGEEGEAKQGVTVLAGWDPRVASQGGDIDFLYIRGH